jgi:hypothetical protein
MKWISQLENEEILKILFELKVQLTFGTYNTVCFLSGSL